MATQRIAQVPAVVQSRNRSKSSASAKFPGRILDFKKDSLTQFLSASEAGLDFLYSIATEESGVDAETVNLVTSGVAQALSTMLDGVRENMENMAILNLNYQAASRACKAVQSIEQRVFDDTMARIPSA